MRPSAGVRRHARRRPSRSYLAAAVAALAAAPALSGCTVPRDTVPSCGNPQRLAIVAQSVPGAAYVPCIRELPQGWSAAAFDAANGRTTFSLNSDRAVGRPVKVSLVAGCTVTGASPTAPRAPGVRTYLRYKSINPRFAGTLYDVFPGGCVTYSFDFDLAASVALMGEFESATGLYARQQLRLDLRKKLGVELDP